MHCWSLRYGYINCPIALFLISFSYHIILCIWAFFHHIFCTYKHLLSNEFFGQTSSSLISLSIPNHECLLSNLDGSFQGTVLLTGWNELNSLSLFLSDSSSRVLWHGWDEAESDTFNCCYICSLNGIIRQWWRSTVVSQDSNETLVSKPA